jgi:predicted adenine nucleotide alpha hydrolase (AANH) superfamily ATPase
MNKVNFDAQMEEIIKSCHQGKNKKLLLHSCCAPCSTACIERLKDFFDLTIYYYNPNIDTDLEYQKRLLEQIRYCDTLGVKVISDGYLGDEYLSNVASLEKEKEGGARCEKCFYLRLKKTAKKAKENGFDLFMTTLTVSPLKNADLINKIGKMVEMEEKIEYLVSDFKKKNGYRRSIELSKENDLYRQNYCGCKFSKSSL